MQHLSGAKNRDQEVENGYQDSDDRLWVYPLIEDVEEFPPPSEIDDWLGHQKEEYPTIGIDNPTHDSIRRDEQAYSHSAENILCGTIETTGEREASATIRNRNVLS